MKGPAVRRLSRAPVGQESGAQGVGTSTGREGKTFASGNVEASPTRPVLATEVTVDHNRNTTMKRGGKLETVNRFGGILEGKATLGPERHALEGGEERRMAEDRLITRKLKGTRSTPKCGRRATLTRVAGWRRRATVNIWEGNSK